MSIESIQLINTALIKLREKKINYNFDDRLKSLNDSPVVDILHKAIVTLAENQKVTRDQAALMMMEFVVELNAVWNDFITTEGIDKMKENLSTGENHT